MGTTSIRGFLPSAPPLTASCLPSKAMPWSLFHFVVIPV